MTRTIGAIVIGVLLLVLLFGWWVGRRSVPEDSYTGFENVTAQPVPAAPAPAEPPKKVEPVPVNLIFPDNINITIRKEKAAAPVVRVVPRATTPRAPARRTAPSVAARPSTPDHSHAAKPAAGSHEGDITPELLERQFKKYLHNKTQEFLRQYPRQ